MGGRECAQEGLTVAFQADGQRHRGVFAGEGQEGGDQEAGGEVPAGGKGFAVEPEGFEPGEFVVGEMGKAAESERLGHQAEVLEDHPHLQVHEVRHELFELADGDDAAVGGIVVEVPAATGGEASQPGGSEAAAFVEDVDPGVLVGGSRGGR